MAKLNGLRSFVAVVSSGNLSATARSTCVSKSSLSRQLKKLEDDLGHTLLKRQSNRLIPTEAGRIYYRYCVQILQLSDNATHELECLSETVQGELVLYIDNGLLRGWLGDVVAQFMTCYPDVNVTLRTDLRQGSKGLRDNIILWMGACPASAQRQECLSLLGQGVYGSHKYFEHHGYPRHPEDLKSHQWIQLLGSNEEFLTLTGSDASEVRITLPASRIQTDQLVLHADAISNAQGLGVFPHWQAQMHLRARPGCFERCLVEWEAPCTPIWLLYPHGKLARKEHAFLGHLRRNLPAFWGGAGLN